MDEDELTLRAIALGLAVVAWHGIDAPARKRSSPILGTANAFLAWLKEEDANA